MRYIGLIAAYLVNATIVLLAIVTGPVTLGLLVLAVLGLVFLHRHRRAPAIVMWAILAAFYTAGFVITLARGDERDLSGLAGLIVAVQLLCVWLALVASIRIDPRIAKARVAAAAAAEAARHHEQRVAAISQWEAAYRTAHGGAEPPPGFAPPIALGASSDRTNTMAILALVFGLGGGLGGVIFGHISLVQIRRSGERGRGMAIAGLVLGYVNFALLLGLGIWVLASS